MNELTRVGRSDGERRSRAHTCQAEPFKPRPRKERLLMRFHPSAVLMVLLGITMVAGCSDDPASPGSGNNPPLDNPVFVTEFVVDATAMAVDNAGHLLFSNPHDNRITRHTVTGDLVDTWSPLSREGSELWPIYLEYFNGNLVVVSAMPNPSRIVVFDSDGALRQEWPEQYNHDGGWAGGVDQIAIDRDGNIYTLRFDEEAVVKYAPDGTFEREWLTHGTNPSGYSWPNGIVVGPNDIVYISDALHHRVLMFSRRGELVGEIGEEGGSNGQFRWPTGLAIDDHGILYVVDRLNLRVQMLTLGGDYIAEFATGSIGKSPVLITVHDNDVHVLHMDNVVKYFAFRKRVWHN